MENFNKLLFTELRILESDGVLESSSENLTEAMTDNENLKALGYQLDYESIVRLAQAYSRQPNMTPLYKRVMEFEPGIEISPMYPDFPKQVLEMDELTYRIHQLLHYLTTYGLEEMLSIEVQEGWLPHKDGSGEIERIEDEQIADLKTLEFLAPEDVDERVIKGLIERKERLETKEVEIAQAVMLRTKQLIKDVPFKENIGLIYGGLLLEADLDDRYATLEALAAIVKHPGDVLDLTEYMVVKNKYKHLKTSVKRGLVELLEQFPVRAIEENLASNRWSNAFLGKGGKPRTLNRNIALIDYLSFNRFSKNENIKKVVTDLKSGKLVSWNQKLEKAYDNNSLNEVVNLLSQRPGIMFRQVNRLISKGVSPNEISGYLSKSAGELKTQTIVSALNNFDGSELVVQVFLNTLIANLSKKNIEELKGKKIYIDSKGFDLTKSKLEITDKFVEGGYISNGLAVRIPEKAKFLRFFTYWNDKRRIDIDLHGVSIDKNDEINHIGWHGAYKSDYLVHSGDITHSNATEYIDLDIERAIEDGLSRVQFNINSYTQVPFSRIETVFTGLMVLGEMREEVELYDAKNVLFRHDLDYNAMSIDYGMIDIENKIIYVGGKPSKKHNDTNVFELPNHNLTIAMYLNLLLTVQGAAAVVQDKNEADLILGLAKSDEDNYISLIDENFFM